MSKILANEIANFGDDSPIDLKEGLNIPVGKPLQAAGSSGTSGQVLSTTGSTVEWVTPFSGSYTDLSNRPTIPAAQVNADWNSSSGISAILNKPVVPPLSSVTTATAGTASLSFNPANGEFTFTPPDLSSYATTTSLTTALSNSNNWDTAYGWGNHASAGYLTSLGDAAGVTTAKINNWDTSFGWGDHASAGYLTSYTETDTLDSVLTRGASTTRDITTTGKILYSNNYANLADLPSASTYHGMFAHVHNEGHGYYAHAGAWLQLLDEGSSIDDLADVDTTTVAPQAGQVLKWNGVNWIPSTDLTGGGGGGLALTDLSASTATASGGGSFAYNNATGAFTYTPPDLSNYDTAFGWGDHASEGYITSIGDAIQDADFTGNGLMKRSGAGTYTSVPDNSSNWDTAFGWGNHGSQGYLTSLPSHGIGNHDDVTISSVANNQLIKYNTSLGQWVNFTPDFATETWVQSQGYLTSYTETQTLDDVLSLGASTTRDITTTGKILYSNNYANLGDLPSASTYHGMFAHVHAQGHGYFAHGGAWQQLLDESSSINELSDVTTGTASTGDVLTWSGSAWAAAAPTGGGNTQVSISDTIPAGSASAGDLWWESDTGRLKIYYQDVDSAQWVDVNAPLRQDRIASTGAPSSATDTGVAGDIRYDSNYVYIAVGTNTWKRAALTTW